MFRHVREILNVFALLMVLSGMLLGFHILRDLREGLPPDLRGAIRCGVLFAPALLLLATGQMFTAAFFSSLFYGGARSSEQGYSREKSWAREGKARDAALGMLWRDRLVGDAKALWAVLEMARLDKSLDQEAVKAANRIIGSARSSAADRDHAGRMLQLVRVSRAKPHYSRTD